jgi:hypothetical protein
MWNPMESLSMACLSLPVCLEFAIKDGLQASDVRSDCTLNNSHAYDSKRAEFFCKFQVLVLMLIIVAPISRTIRPKTYYDNPTSVFSILVLPTWYRLDHASNSALSSAWRNAREAHVVL